MNRVRASWNKYPTVAAYLEYACAYGDVNACSSIYISAEEASALIWVNRYPIYDRPIPMYGLTLEMDNSGKYYIKVPSISYFIDNPQSGSLARFYNLTERCSSMSSSLDVTWDPDYQNIYEGDVVNIVRFDRRNLMMVTESSASVVSTNPGASTFLLVTSPSEFVLDISTEMYVLNQTERTVYSLYNNINNYWMEIDVSYPFRANQLVSLIVDDGCTGQRWGTSSRVLDTSLLADVSYFGNLCYVNGNFPQFVLDNSLRYTIKIKHAWHTFADFMIDVSYSIEQNGYFNVYLKDNYNLQHYLDSTFVFTNMLFDPDLLNQQWYGGI